MSKQVFRFHETILAQSSLTDRCGVTKFAGFGRRSGQLLCSTLTHQWRRVGESSKKGVNKMRPNFIKVDLNWRDLAAWQGSTSVKMVRGRHIGLPCHHVDKPESIDNRELETARITK